VADVQVGGRSEIGGANQVVGRLALRWHGSGVSPRWVSRSKNEGMGARIATA
jgi:hypothetical protein